MTTGLTAAPATGEAHGGPPAPVSAETGAGAAWVSLSLTVLTRGYRAFLLTLLVAALVPTLWSWSSYVVRSGSMEPALTVGDVVVTQPFSTSDPVPVGRVMVFENPAFPSGQVLLVHRVVEYLGGSEYVTAGDANLDVDATPVPAESFRAQARILVPYVGLPLVWLRGDDYLLLGGWLLLTVAAFVRAARRGRTPDEPDESGDPDAGDGPQGHRGRRLHWSHGHPTWHSHGQVSGHHHPRHAVPLTGLVALVGLLGLAVGAGLGSGVVPAAAAFTATTHNSSNTWTAGAFLQAYNAAVLADDPYVYYLVDETGGTAAADYSGNDRVGAYASIATYHQPGALPNNPGYSVGLGGLTGRLVSGGNALGSPNTVSLELWFRTTTTTGGKLIGFESTRNLSSSSYDRHVFMAPDGTLVYGGWTAPQIRTITSPLTYNDGAWHHLVLTAVPHGQQQDAVMYVDGSAVAAGTTTRTSYFSGWWRVGYGNLRSGAGYPTTRGFAGSLDQVAVYDTRLSATRVTAHYAAR